MRWGGSGLAVGLLVGPYSPESKVCRYVYILNWASIRRLASMFAVIALPPRKLLLSVKTNCHIYVASLTTLTYLIHF